MKDDASLDPSNRQLLNIWDVLELIWNYIDYISMLDVMLQSAPLPFKYGTFTGLLINPHGITSCIFLALESTHQKLIVVTCKKEGRGVTQGPHLHNVCTLLGTNFERYGHIQNSGMRLPLSCVWEWICHLLHRATKILVPFSQESRLTHTLE